MPYPAVMFDLDGTLADTLADIAAAGNFALTELGLPAIEIARYRYLAGQGLERLVIDALGPARQELVGRGVELFRQYYAAHPLDHMRPYDGIPELLDALTAQGVKLAIFSNKPDFATQQVVTRGFSRWRFDAVVGHRPPTPLKPDPAGALEVARQLAIAPGDWLYVGDTKVDMATARAAKMTAVGVLWGFRDEAELRESGAAAIISHPGELLGLVQGPVRA